MPAGTGDEPQRASRRFIRLKAGFPAGIKISSLPLNAKTPFKVLFVLTDLRFSVRLYNTK